MAQIELEQKYVLDMRAALDIRKCLREREQTLNVREIRQCYHVDGSRFRSVTTDEPFHVSYLKELKTGVKLGTSYSVNVEDDEAISRAEFDLQWYSNQGRRLQKTRYSVLLSHYEQRTLVVDFFHTDHELGIYAALAEVELILNAETQFLQVSNFLPPPYLFPFILQAVNDSEDQSFRSFNLVDTPKSIENIQRAYQQLYDKSV